MIWGVGQYVIAHTFLRKCSSNVWLMIMINDYDIICK